MTACNRQIFDEEENVVSYTLLQSSFNRRKVLRY